MVNPVFPIEDILGFQKIMLNKMIKQNQNYFKAVKIITNPPKVEVGTTPAEVAYRINNIKLLHYKPLTEKQESIPILII